IWAPDHILDSPIAPARMLRAASIPRDDWLPGHRGIDLAASAGQQVRSPGAGTVTFAGHVVDRPVITVTHDNGLISSMEPVESSLAAGTPVATGDWIGVVSETVAHCGTAACVHWGVRDADGYVDPLDVLRGFGAVRLLPMSEAAIS
ncbi:M23 family metallopeptidase, partial [uncultured Demequina sp.]|uniref:M23 family metallopeptidase n=1 Tax=uncultured Demequina sp. TaxID=693499 RepID=UPI0025D8D34D